MIILARLVVVQSWGILKILTEKNLLYYLVNVLKFLELWTATKYARIITFTNGRGVLKTSFQWLFNGVKQNNPRVLLTVKLWPKVVEL